MKIHVHISALLVLFLAISHCRTATKLETSRIQTEASATGVGSLPQLTNAEDLFNEVLVAVKKNGNFSAADAKAYATKISRYLAFLGMVPGKPLTKDVLNRLLASSTQFIVCDDFNNWVCLEEFPKVVPNKKSRIDTASDLGTPIEVNAPLAMTAYFTEQWDVNKSAVDYERVLAKHLAQKINERGKDGIWMALYGIDEANGNMKPVYDALIAKISAGVPVKGVFDNKGYNDKAKFPIVFSYIKPSSSNWIFDRASNGKPNLDFQYNSTIDLINAMNKGISNNANANARLERPNATIMHNKFFVFKTDDKLSVWTGTANVSDECMGSDRNTNMGIFIDNSEIGQTYLDEFNEMFHFQPTTYSDEKGRLINKEGKKAITIGAFQGDKRPNTKRYFRFSDDSEVRVHFAPTDDAEHRVLIPMLLAAQPGDELRIAMFGAGGIEYVRALQYAAARGAIVQIVLDNLTGSGNHSWIANPSGNILDKNPYLSQPKGRIAVRKSKWKGNNHLKTGTLSRRHGDVMKTEILVVGSQNWSKTGNDENDENLITIRNLAAEVAAGKLFNEYFDKRLWPAAKEGELVSAQ